MDNRYTRNFPSISEDDQKTLELKTVCVIGCGGLGGHNIEALARIGVGNIVLVDCDSFSESNLNRQLFCKESNINKDKALEAAKRVNEINSSVNTIVYSEKFTEDNAETIISNCDIVIDALDNIAARMILAKACAKAGIYLIHGAVGGWNFQVAAMEPGSSLFEKLYGNIKKTTPPSVLSFTPFVCAGIQVAKAIDILLHPDEDVNKKLLLGDLKNSSFMEIEM